MKYQEEKASVSARLEHLGQKQRGLTAKRSSVLKPKCGKQPLNLDSYGGMTREMEKEGTYCFDHYRLMVYPWHLRSKPA